MKLEKVSEYLERYPDVSLLGFAWSCYWRLWVAMMALYLGAVLIIALLVGIGEIFS